MSTKNISKVIAWVWASLITWALVMNLDTTLADSSKKEAKKEKTNSWVTLKKEKSETWALNEAVKKKIILSNLKQKKKLISNTWATTWSGKIKPLPKSGSWELTWSWKVKPIKTEVKKELPKYDSTTSASH